MAQYNNIRPMIIHEEFGNELFVILSRSITCDLDRLGEQLILEWVE